MKDNKFILHVLVLLTLALIPLGSTYLARVLNENTTVMDIHETVAPQTYYVSMDAGFMNSIQNMSSVELVEGSNRIKLCQGDRLYVRAVISGTEPEKLLAGYVTLTDELEKGASKAKFSGALSPYVWDESKNAFSSCSTHCAGWRNAGRTDVAVCGHDGACGAVCGLDGESAVFAGCPTFVCGCLAGDTYCRCTYAAPDLALRPHLLFCHLPAWYHAGRVYLDWRTEMVEENMAPLGSQPLALRAGPPETEGRHLHSVCNLVAAVAPHSLTD